MKELQSLIDFGNASPALPTGHPFSGVLQSADFWSSTTYAAISYVAWHVVLTDGLIHAIPKDNFTLGVWPVRGGK